MKLNTFERFALSHHLSAFPEDASLDEIFQMMRDYDEDVLVWEIFYQEETEDVIFNIINMIHDLEDTFIPKENLYRKNPQYTDIVSDGGMDPRT